MAVIFYNIFLGLFKAGIHIAALFNAKAKKWVQGRKNILDRMKSAIPDDEKIIWVHCASLGEFEQGRPVMEELKKKYPAYKLLLTFFSPSGYEVQKNYPQADWVFYLPLDGPRTAKRFLEIVKPSLVIFVKYEFWYYYLKKIKYRNIPLLLISAIFRKDMTFFKWYGGLQRKMLSRFDHLFVQTRLSKKLVDKIGLQGISTVSGDTRFDRVIEIAEKGADVPAIEQFIGSRKAIIAGSTWPEDELVIEKAFTTLNDSSLTLIIAPHEIGEKHLAAFRELFPAAVFFTELNDQPVSANVLVIDNIGMLSRLYRYAHITYIGGGLTENGVHNVLEAAVYSKPVIFGPYYKKYAEAIGLVESGGGISFEDPKRAGDALKDILQSLLLHPEDYSNRSEAAGNYVRSNSGATALILQFIQEKRLLTN